jgi:pyridoxine/pyridoxamine 5'-phosphate oxidase
MPVDFTNSEFDPSALPLSELRFKVWNELQLACANMDHPWRLPVLATVTEDAPQQRIVVLRRADAASAEVFAYTDVRAPKVEQIRRHSRVSWHFYHPNARIQVCLNGTALLHVADELSDRHWKESSLTNRIAFLAERPPGALADRPSVNVPEGLRDRIPEAAETEMGRANFAVIASPIDEIDLLFVRRSGNLRAHFQRTEGQWSESWLEP